MPLQLPDNRHDSILWLFDQLEGVAPSDERHWSGTLPAEYDFADVCEHFETPGSTALFVGTDAATRTIVFSPSWGNVYPNVAALLRIAANQRANPRSFTVFTPRYSHREPPAVPIGVDNEGVPAVIQRYLDTVAFCKALSALADHDASSGEILHFIHRHDAKLAVQLTYGVDDLGSIPHLRDFLTEYIESTLHVDQKRNIFRASLLEIFKGRSAVTVAELLLKFGELYGLVRDSYAMYAADFSVERMRRELERLNLDDTLRLNKTLSDIQNQLLALPAALILAGASVTADSPSRTIATLVGIVIFSWLMFVLVSNQKSSIKAIEAEIDLREVDLSSQPATVAARYTGSLGGLRQRISRQLCTLKWIRTAVWIVLLSVLVLASIALANA